MNNCVQLLLLTVLTIVNDPQSSFATLILKKGDWSQNILSSVKLQSGYKPFILLNKMNYTIGSISYSNIIFLTVNLNSFSPSIL